LSGLWHLPDGELIVNQSGAWCSLHPDLFPGQKSFFAKEWLDVLEKYPELRTLVYKNPQAIAKRLESSAVTPGGSSGVSA